MEEMNTSPVKRAVLGFVADHIFRGRRVLETRNLADPSRRTPAWMLHEIGAADYFRGLVARVPFKLLAPYAPSPVLTLTGYHRKRVDRLVGHVQAGTAPRRTFPAIPRTLTGQDVVAFRIRHEPWLLELDDLKLIRAAGPVQAHIQMSDATIDVVARLLLNLDGHVDHGGPR